MAKTSPGRDDSRADSNTTSETPKDPTSERLIAAASELYAALAAIVEDDDDCCQTTPESLARAREALRLAATCSPALKKPRGPVTGRLEFNKTSGDGPSLFEVRPGIPVIEVLYIASNYLASASCQLYGLISDLSEDCDDSLLGPAYLVDMSKAIIDAATLGGFEGDRS